MMMMMMMIIIITTTIIIITMTMMMIIILIIIIIIIINNDDNNNYDNYNINNLIRAFGCTFQSQYQNELTVQSQTASVVLMATEAMNCRG